MNLEQVSVNRAFGGSQEVWRHTSQATGGQMTFSIFIPPHAPAERLPVLWYLSGLTCTHANVTEKGDYRRACAERGIIFVAPDTSPRGDDVADDDAYDFGKGAGFYVDATQEPWAPHYRMRSYIESELPALIAQHFPVDMERQGITGHSMGGHGALTIALRNPGRFASVSAFAPIVAPMQCPWGEKALGGYLGGTRDAWRAYDAVALIEDGARLPDLLVDQGEADGFLEGQLKTHLLVEACDKAGIPATIRMQPGYDHSYYFISSFMEDHVNWHGARLGGADPPHSVQRCFLAVVAVKSGSLFATQSTNLRTAGLASSPSTSMPWR
jgi:S-formylglutathione hydrolase